MKVITELLISIGKIDSDQNDMITLNLSGGAIDTAQINYEEVDNSFTISIGNMTNRLMTIYSE